MLEFVQNRKREPLTTLPIAAAAVWITSRAGIYLSIGVTAAAFAIIVFAIMVLAIMIFSVMIFSVMVFAVMVFAVMTFAIFSALPTLAAFASWSQLESDLNSRHSDSYQNLPSLWL